MYMKYSNYTTKFLVKICLKYKYRWPVDTPFVRIIFYVAVVMSKTQCPKFTIHCRVWEGGVYNVLTLVTYHINGIQTYICTKEECKRGLFSIIVKLIYSNVNDILASGQDPSITLYKIHAIGLTLIMAINSNMYKRQVNWIKLKSNHLSSK